MTTRWDWNRIAVWFGALLFCLACWLGLVWLTYKLMGAWQ